MSALGYGALFNLGVKLSRKAARAARKGGSKAYERILAPSSGRAVNAVTGAGDYVADMIMNNPLKAAYLGGTGYAVYSALDRAPKRFFNSAHYEGYRYT